jgi:hypothetical protein
MNVPYAYGEPIAPVYGQPMTTGRSYYREGMGMGVGVDPYYPNNGMNMLVLTEQEIMLRRRRRNTITGVIAVLIIAGIISVLIWAI